MALLNDMNRSMSVTLNAKPRPIVTLLNIHKTLPVIGLLAFNIFLFTTRMRHRDNTRESDEVKMSQPAVCTVFFDLETTGLG